MNTQIRSASYQTSAAASRAAARGICAQMAQLRLAAAAGVRGHDNSSLDELAAAAPDGEELPIGLAALFPEVAAQHRLTISAFFIGQGAVSRTDVLQVLRINGGEAVMWYGRNAQPPFKLMALGALESMAVRAYPAAREGQQGAAEVMAPAAAPAAGAAPSEDDVADFGVLRPLLDASQIGEPTEEGIPWKLMFDGAIAAGCRPPAFHSFLPDQ